MKPKISSLSGFLAPQRLIQRKRSNSRDSSTNSLSKSIGNSGLQKQSKFLKALQDSAEDPQSLKEQTKSSSYYPQKSPPSPRASNIGSVNRKGQTSEQLSREQAKRSIDELSNQLRQQFQIINSQIENFNKSLRKIIDNQYQKMRDAVIAAIEDIFDSSKQKIRKLYKIEGQYQNKQLFSVNRQLQKLIQELEHTKHNISGQNWKTATAQYLAEQQQVQGYARNLISKSHRIKINQQIRLYFDEKRSEAFGDALERLLELTRGGRRREQVS